eukprot:3468897-Pleurochrysis_carterae.AAC.1
MLVASCAGHRGIVSLLLSAGASVFKQDRSHGRSALMHAAARGHAAVVRALLHAGAPINALDPNGVSALQLAVAGAHGSTVEELLRQGASVDGAERRGSAGWDELIAMANDVQAVDAVPARGLFWLVLGRGKGETARWAEVWGRDRTLVRLHVLKWVPPTARARAFQTRTGFSNAQALNDAETMVRGGCMG